MMGEFALAAPLLVFFGFCLFLFLFLPLAGVGTAVGKQAV